MKKKIYFDVPGIAELFGVSSKQAYLLLRKGDIQGFRVGGLWRITPEAIESFVRSGGSVKSTRKATA